MNEGAPFVALAAQRKPVSARQVVSGCLGGQASRSSAANGEVRRHRSSRLLLNRHGGHRQIDEQTVLDPFLVRNESLCRREVGTHLAGLENRQRPSSSFVGSNPTPPLADRAECGIVEPSWLGEVANTGSTRVIRAVLLGR